MGIRGWILFGLTVPIGLLQGAAEVAFGVALIALLSYFGFVSPDEGSSIPFSASHPIATIAGVAILAALLRISAQIVPGLANETVVARVRNAIIDRLLLGLQEDSKLTVAEVSHIIGQLASRGGAFLQSISSITTTACLILMLLLSMAKLSSLLTAIVLAALVGIGIAILLARRLYDRYANASHANVALFSRTIVKVARNVHLLKITGIASKQREQLLEASREQIRNFGRYLSIFSITSNIPVLFGTFLVIVILRLNTDHQFMPTVTMVPFIYLLNRLAGTVQTFSMTFGQMVSHAPYVRELLTFLPELFTEHQAARGGDTPGEFASLKVSNLAIGRETPILENVSFDLQHGDTCLVTGPSGRGKTTMLMTLIGLVDPLGGSITLDGKPVEHLSLELLRQSVGYAGADPYLVDGSVRDNLMIGVNADTVAEADLERAIWGACAEFVHDLPNGLEHVLRENGDGISAGQKQRISMARCILRNPKILLLDEATANIDEATEEVMMERIRHLFPEVIIIMISHRTSLRPFATQVVNL